MIPNKTKASEYRVRTLDRNDLNEKGKIFIGQGGTSTIDKVENISNVAAKNIIDAINENATGKDISAGSFTAASFKGNADSATRADSADKINVDQLMPTNITRTGLYACNVSTAMGDESTVIIAIRDLSSDVYGLGAYYDGKLTYGGVKYNSTYKRIDVVNTDVFYLDAIYLITTF